MVLLMFTGSYPFDVAAEQTFISREIPHLLNNFERIILVPKVCDGHCLEVPTKVEEDEDFAIYIKWNSHPLNLVGKAFSSQNFFQEIRSDPTLLFYPAKILKLILFLGKAELTRSWVSKWIDSNNMDLNHCLFYSYWFDHVAMGLGLIKEKYPQVKVVSRAHGYDIYEERYFPYYWPCRRQALDNLDKLYLASNDGRNYFRDRYPEFYGLFETAHLGVDDPGFISNPSMDHIFRIISCAHIFPLKRVDLLIEGIALAARNKPEQQFEWTHFGDGKQRRALQKLVEKVFPANAKGDLPGYVPNPEILKHYRNSSVDIFVNLSETEGGAPVSIMEASSCGIPIIATNVGGNPEIVFERNGLLLSQNPTREEVAQALLKICDDPELAHEMRIESRRIWEESYNAEVNFCIFAERLKAIRQS